jgi:hypothetical protein
MSTRQGTGDANPSRRGFIRASAAGLAGTTLAAGLVSPEIASGQVAAGLRSAAPQGLIPKGNNSFSNPYRQNFLDSCCYKGQNTTAPDYVLRP